MFLASVAKTMGLKVTLLGAQSVQMASTCAWVIYASESARSALMNQSAGACLATISASHAQVRLISAQRAAHQALSTSFWATLA